MMHVEPSFVLYALRLDPGCCLRAHTVLSGTVEPEKKKTDKGFVYADDLMIFFWEHMLLKG